MPNKKCVWEIWDKLGETFIGYWNDAPYPEFDKDAQGIPDLTIKLPRSIGRIGEPYEAGSDGTMVHGYRVICRVTDDTTRQDPGGVSLASFIIPGTTIAGDPAGLSRVIWQGTIERWTPTYTEGTEVLLLALRWVLKRIDIATNFVVAGDPVQAARRLVDENTQVLSWDPDNPSSADVGFTVNATFKAPQSLDQILEELRRLAGINWHCYVTELGTVRFRPQPTTTTHTLTVGVEASDPKLEDDGLNILTKVTVWGSGTIKETVEAPGYSKLNPRNGRIQATHITDAGTARELAQLALDRNTYSIKRGTCRVIDFRASDSGLGHDIDDISVGDTIALQFSTPGSEEAPSLAGFIVPGQTKAGLRGYGEGLTVAKVGYHFYYADLEFGKIQPDLTYDVVAIANSVAKHEAGHA